MALKAKLTTLDGLSDAIKALYRQVDDHYLLDVEAVDGFALEDINGLKTTVGKQKTEINNLKSTLKTFEVDGQPIDASAAISALAKMKELGNLTPEQLADQKVKAALGQATDQFNKQLKAKDDELGSVTNHLQSVLIDQAATTALASKGGNVKLLLPHVKASVKMVKTDKGFNVQVVDAEGNGRIHVSGGRTSDMTLEQFVEEMAASTDFASAFDAKSKGGGAGNKTDVRGQQNNVRPKSVSANDQAAVNGSIADIAAGRTVVEMN